MGWEEEKRNRMLAQAAKFDARERKRKKKLLRLIVVVACFGIVIILVDAFTRNKGTTVSINFENKEQTVAKWMQSGFVKSLDETTAAVVVDEATWKKISEGERKAVVVLLGSYCAERSNRMEYRLTVKGNSSQSLLASIDDKGVNIK